MLGLRAFVLSRSSLWGPDLNQNISPFPHIWERLGFVSQRREYCNSSKGNKCCLYLLSCSNNVVPYSRKLPMSCLLAYILIILCSVSCHSDCTRTSRAKESRSVSHTWFSILLRLTIMTFHFPNSLPQQPPPPTTAIPP